MTGRGIDQILANPSDPRLFEPVVTSALEYVKLAERVNGPIGRPVGPDYVWGDALGELERLRPAARIVNLETAVTVSRDAWPDKEIHYRMHPANVPCLTAARIDCCVLANNHVLDWERSGLEETLVTLHGAGIRTAGAGHDENEALSPAAITASATTRILLYGFAFQSSGVPREWRATRERAGVAWIERMSPGIVEEIGRRISRDRRSGDIVIASLHWGGNWGYTVSRGEREFAHRLIDTAGVDLVHGHSSHHPKGIEVYQRKAILYGCGDLLNDYEGIAGYDAFRGELALMYFPKLGADTGDLLGLTMVPTHTRRFRINRASTEDVRWLQERMDRECTKLGAHVARRPEGTLSLEWK
jgi:poly-gamma-glutamate synthesis protein (capsule biosynthesis protein)